MRYVGIDYSIRCPAICIFETNELPPVWYPENCQIHFLTDKKKYAYRITPNIIGYHAPVYKEQDEMDRFNKISNWALDLLTKQDIIGIEEYAFSAQGMVYKIGENTGLLKYKMWSGKMNFECISNSKPKKLATGKGNADKQSVYDAFCAETGWNIHHHIQSRSNKIMSPLTDVADSYWICKYLFQKHTIASSMMPLP
jgi:Holliday junction resolvasome RuvABC endonuclease subunit